MTDLSSVTIRLDSISSKLDSLISVVSSGLNTISAKLDGAGSGSSQEIINNQKENTQQIIDNQNSGNQAIQDNADANADKIKDSVDDLKDGFDSSGLDGDNAALSDKLNQYQQAEDEVMKDVNDNINNFEFTNPLEKMGAVLEDISYFLSGIYYALDALNIPIAFSLTLTIALLCIGWYRFRGS